MPASMTWEQWLYTSSNTLLACENFKFTTKSSRLFQKTFTGHPQRSFCRILRHCNRFTCTSSLQLFLVLYNNSVTMMCGIIAPIILYYKDSDFGTLNNNYHENQSFAPRCSSQQIVVIQQHDCNINFRLLVSRILQASTAAL